MGPLLGLTVSPVLLCKRLQMVAGLFSLCKPSSNCACCLFAEVGLCWSKFCVYTLQVV